MTAVRGRTRRLGVALAVLAGLVATMAAPAAARPSAAGAHRPAPSACRASVGATGITGTVHDAVSGRPVAGSLVAALRVSDHAVVAATTAGPDGAFEVAAAAGTYRIFLLDPSGEHRSGLHGGPGTTITVTPGALTSVSATLIPTRGSLAGTITGEPAGTGILGAWTVAVDAASGRPARAAVADATGAYRIDGLRTGAHLVVAVDPSGRHRTTYAGGGPGPSGSTPVSVAAGGVAVSSVGLPGREAPGSGHPIEGTVRDGDGAALEGVMVLALGSADYALVAGTRTGADGTYRLGLPSGTYVMGFLDPSGRHSMRWHADRPHDQLGAATPVAVPASLDAQLPSATGTVGGTVVDDPTGAPLDCIWVVAIDAAGEVAGATTTGPDGSYTLHGLAPGSYRISFVDPAGGRGQEYWGDSLTYVGSTPLSVAAGDSVVADGDLVAASPFGNPTQWVARQFTELLGRAPSPVEWKAWTDFYGSRPACTAAHLSLLGQYLTGLASPTVPGVPPGPSVEFDSLYPSATPLDRALRAAAVVRAAYGHDANESDWNSRIRPYVEGTATWSSTVNGLYAFIMAFVGTGPFCSLQTPAYPFTFTRAVDLRAKVAALYPGTPLAPSRTQAELTTALAAAAIATTPAGRTVALRAGEVVRVGGAANGNQQLSIPAGVTLTTEGVPDDAPSSGGGPGGLAYVRMGRIVPATTPGTPASSPTDGLVCAGAVCHSTGMVSMAPGSHLVGVWVDGQGLGDRNHRLALVQTNGSAAESSATVYEDGTSVAASRLSEPPRGGAGVRLAGASTGSPCVGERVDGNLVTGYTSRHEFDRRGQAAWVDGITVACEDATVSGNDVVDVTDLGIVVHGSLDRDQQMTRQRSDVRANTVVSAGLDAHVALGADAIGPCLPLRVDDASGAPKPAVPVPCLDLDTPRDFTGARIRDNQFFTGSRTSFDVGLMIGGGSMWGDHRVVNQGPDEAHPDARGVDVVGNTTGGVPTRVNIGIDVHDMTDATVTGNATTFRLVDGNPRITWGRCPQLVFAAGEREGASLTTDAAFSVGDGSRGCVIGAPPAAGLERLELSPDGSAFVGSSTGSTLRVWGGDLDVERESERDIEWWADEFRDVRRMGLNVIRLLLDTEEYVDEPACATCDPTPNTAAVEHLGEIARAAEDVGLYLDITGNGISYHHHRGTWFDELDASPEAELVRWRAQEVFWEAVAAELRPRTSVAWYDLINEPTLPANGGPAPTWCFTADLPPDEPCWNPNIVKSLTDPADPGRQRTYLEVARAWTRRMLDAIKVRAGDTVHPVSVGQLSFCAGPMNQASQELADFDMVHRYPQDSTLETDVATVNNCKQPGRSLVVEETYLTASYDTLEQFLDRTEARTAGYLGHVIGGTPIQVLEWIESHDPDDDPGAYWAHVFWYAWDQFALRQVAARNPTGPGIMAG